MRSSYVLRMQLCGAELGGAWWQCNCSWILWWGGACSCSCAQPASDAAEKPPAQEQLQEGGGRTAAESCRGQHPAGGSCSLLTSWWRGEGGYSLARPTAPPLLGKYEEHSSAVSSDSVSRFSRSSKFSSLVLRLLRGHGCCCICMRRRLFISAASKEQLWR